MKKLLPILAFVFIIASFAQAKGDSERFSSILVEARKWVKGHPDQPWDYYPTRILTDNPVKKDKVNIYGSRTDQKVKATGFFRTEKIAGRWWVVDPDGYLNVQRGINSFRKGTSERNNMAFEKLYDSDTAWVKASAKIFRHIGINGIGSWSNDELVRAYNKKSSGHKLSYSVNLGMMTAYGKKRGGTYQLAGNTGFPNQTIFVFDPEFPAFCDSLAKASISYLKSDPCLFGYFSDNELPFGLKNLEGYLNLKNPSDPGCVAAGKWLKQNNIAPGAITDKERAEFAGFVAERYFRIVSEAICKADPNHMYLGSRLHGSAKFIPSVMQAAGRYCDVVSINYYGVWTPETKHLQSWAEWTAKPFIITEFYTKAMDSGLANTTGAGYTVHTQKDRGYAYQDFCLALFESGHCIGWHYFKYQDNDPTAQGVDPSNIDSNKGIINNNYVLYNDLTNSMKQFNNQIYRLIDNFDH